MSRHSRASCLCGKLLRIIARVVGIFQGWGVHDDSKHGTVAAGMGFLVPTYRERGDRVTDPLLIAAQERLAAKPAVRTAKRKTGA